MKKSILTEYRIWNSIILASALLSVQSLQAQNPLDACDSTDVSCIYDQLYKHLENVQADQEFLIVELHGDEESCVNSQEPIARISTFFNCNAIAQKYKLGPHYVKVRGQCLEIGNSSRLGACNYIKDKLFD